MQDEDATARRLTGLTFDEANRMFSEIIHELAMQRGLSGYSVLNAIIEKEVNRRLSPYGWSYKRLIEHEQY